MTSQDNLLKAIGSLLPEDAREKVTNLVAEYLTKAEEAAQSAAKAEAEAALEESYKKLAAQKDEVTKTAEKGYAEAYEIICDLRNRLEVQKEEYEQQLEEGYEEAYQMLQEVRSKNDTLEVDLYQEYDNRLGEIKEFIVDKVDQFLAKKGEEFYETAERNVRNDPTMAEHKVALDRILEAAAGYLSDEDFTFASNTKIDELARALEEQKGQIKILEARNMRLHTENQKLNEVARQAQDVLTEGVKVEKQARKQLAKNAESRGKREVEKVEVIAETNTAAATEPAANDQNPKNKLFQEWAALAGLPNS
jgi:hypothetical protein